MIVGESFLSNSCACPRVEIGRPLAWAGAGNRLARAAVAAFVVVIVVGYVVLAAVASGWMTYLVERFL
jgi:hypothetical protein